MARPAFKRTRCVTNVFKTARIILCGLFIYISQPLLYDVFYMVVRMRHTRAHTANRRSHHALKAPALSIDKEGTTHLRHRATVDGMYKGRSVLGDPVKKVMKKQGKKPAAKKAVKKTAKKK